MLENENVSYMSFMVPNFLSVSKEASCSFRAAGVVMKLLVARASWYYEHHFAVSWVVTCNCSLLSSGSGRTVHLQLPSLHV